MAGPTFGAVGTFGSGTGTSIAVDVPDNVAVNDIIVVFMYKDDETAITGLDTGFAEASDSPNPASEPQHYQFHVLWKRATAADSTGGTYTFSWTNSVYRSAVAARYPGAVTTGNPWDATASSATATAGVSPPAVSVTTTGPDRLLVYGASAYNSGAWTPPGGFTERVDQGDMTVADLAQAVAGSTGSLQATQASSTHTAWLGALIPAGSAAPSPTALQAAQPWPPFQMPRLDAIPLQLLGDRVQAGSTTGALAGTTGAPTGALVATLTDAGALAGTTAAPAGALVGDVIDSAALAGTTASPSGALTGDVIDAGALAGTTAAPAGAIAATLTAPTDPTQAGPQFAPMFFAPPRASVQLAGSTAAADAGSTTGALAGTTGAPVGALPGDVVDAAALAGTTGAPVGAIVAALTDAGALAGVTGSPTGALVATLTDAGALAGTTGAPAGALAGTVTMTGALAGATGAPVGSLTTSSETTGALAGSTGTPTGALVATLTDFAALAGTTGAPAGALVATLTYLAALAGTTGGPVGALAAGVRMTGALAAVTGAPSGGLVDATPTVYPLHPGTVLDGAGRAHPGTVVDLTARLHPGTAS